MEKREMAFPRLISIIDLPDTMQAAAARDFPGAVMCGYDDGAIVAWFDCPVTASLWLAEMIIDSLRQRGLSAKAEAWAEEYLETEKAPSAH
jgi:hypothetical protein